MRAGFPPAIITKDDRQRYYESLEEAQSSNLAPFIALLIDSVEESLAEYEAAKKEQKDYQETIASLVEKFSDNGERGVQNEFEVWSNAMGLLKSYFDTVVEELHNKVPNVKFEIRSFDFLEYEKYVALRYGKTAKRTWFFRTDFISGGKTARYLFFFGFASCDEMKDKCGVTIHIAREDPPDSWNYERLSDIRAPNVPQVHEMGYNPKAEKFVSKGKGRSKQDKMEVLVNNFFQEVREKHFSSD